VCVYCAVRTECLNTVQVNFSLSVSAPPSPLFHTQLHLHVALKPEGQSAKLGTCKINALSESRDHWIETYRDLVVKCDKQTKSDHVTATSLHVTLLRTRHSTAQHSTAQHQVLTLSLSSGVTYKMGEQPGTLAASSYAPTWLSTPVKNTRLRGATEG